MRSSPFLKVLEFKRHLRVEPHGDDRVFLIGERDRFMLQGTIHAQVAPLVDGRRTVGDIAAALQGRVAPAEVFYSLHTLEQLGYVTEHVPDAAPERVAFWQSQGLNAAQTIARLAATAVSIQAWGGLDPASLASALIDAGAQVNERAPLRILLVEDFLLPDLQAHNREALATKAAWMVVKPSGSAPWIGPIFRPGEGPCWACLAHRLVANRPVETFLQRHRGVAGPLATPRASMGASEQVAIQMAALRMVQWIARGADASRDDTLLELDVARLRTTEHLVVRRPQCPACGDAELMKKRAMEPVVLESRPKRFTEDGGYRCEPPEETLARLERCVSPITGVVTSLGPIPGRDHPLRPVYGAAYFICPSDREPTFADFSRPTMGKGRTAVQARAGALCEAIERYSAIAQGDELFVRARLSELEGAVHPDALQNFSEDQYRRRVELNAGVADRRRRVPLPFDESVALSWLPAWSLTEDRRRYLPAAYCAMYLPVAPEAQFCLINPNGHAAGNCLEEAVLQGFLELCERDAVAIWWYNRIRRPAVDLASFEQPYFLELRDHYRSLGHEIWVLDLTHDLGIPTFTALSRSLETGRHSIGFGCHFEARLGVQRALTELNQIFDPRNPTSPWDEVALRDAAFLTPDEAARPRVPSDFPGFVSGDLREDVLTCVARAARAGLEMIVLDQTRPDVPLHAVKVVVPGLRHFWPRLGAGRLYDVPVQLGWAARALTEDELNTVPLFL